MANEKGIDLPIQSILTVLFVSLFMPLIAGGSIGLAADYAGEDLVISSPANVNGYGWALGTQGSCNNTLASGVLNANQYISSSSVTLGSHSYTSLSEPYLDGSTNQLIATCGTVNAPHDFRLILPANIFARNESHSRFMYEWISSSGCTSSCSQSLYDNGYNYDWSLFVNGTEVFGQTDYHSKGFTWFTSIELRSHLKLNYTLNVVDYNNLHTAIGDCENTCSYVLHFDNVVEGTGTDADYSSFVWQTGGAHRIETYTINDFSASMVMKVTPIVLGVAFGLVALASTPFWNPVFKNLSTNMRKQGGLY